MAGSQRPSLRLSGATLRTAASLTRTSAGALTARALFRRDLGLSKLADLPDAWRGPTPIDNAVQAGRAPRQPHDAALGPPAPPEAWPRTSAALTELFRAGQLTPIQHARRALDGARALASRTPSMGPLMTYDDVGAERDALASTERYRAGAPRGPLDGVPVVVKEETALAGFSLRLGAGHLPNEPVPADATMVARLREAGAILLGQSPMTEYGMSPLGANPHRRMPRNPHDTTRAAGGSSTGSAVAVAEGLVPVAVAADGGGSIRIPSCLNGVFGLKPTWGRVSRAGDAFGGTMNHLGPTGASAHDLAIFLEACGQPDDADPATILAPTLPAGSLVRALGRGVRGLRIGVLEGEFDDADPAISAACKEALLALEKEGATLVPLRFDFARYALPVGCVIIGTETYADLRSLYRDAPEAFGPDLQVLLASVGSLSLDEFTDSWRLRTGLRQATAALLRDVDALALPTTAITAPVVTDDELRGFVDPIALGGVCRFSFLANLTGLPAGTAPVGVDHAGLPLGLQIVGDGFDEATVLAVLAHLERTRVASVRRPSVSLDLLG